jgi:hypothetical protein
VTGHLENYASVEQEDAGDQRQGHAEDMAQLMFGDALI